MYQTTSLPVVVIGAGPVGLAAAAHLLERGETPLVIEAGPGVGHHIRQWGHVRVFSPWRYNIDAVCRRLLTSAGWLEPDPEQLPTGTEIVDQYLEPLAMKTALRSHIKLNSQVTAVARRGLDKVRSKGRDAQPFVVRTVDHFGKASEYLAKAVIDASGTWGKSNPIGSSGIAPIGAEGVSDTIDTGIPDVTGSRRKDYENAIVLVVGSGHSAFNIVLDLVAVKKTAPNTQIYWAMRKESLGNVFGGGSDDALPARGALGERARQAVENGDVNLLTPFKIDELSRTEGTRISVRGELAGIEKILVVDRIVAAAGFRPDLEMLRELRLDLDPILEAPRFLGPLIDPNLHSCGTVPPHGSRDLAHPEKGFYIVGMKSYGRAPTFLMVTGYEQVRSIAAEIAGDHEAASRVELELPKTGVCSLDEVDVTTEDKGCCGIEKTGENKPESACCG